MNTPTDAGVMSGPIAIVGAGLIGRAWAVVFARGGHRVRLFDIAAEALDAVEPWLAATAQTLASHGLIDDPQKIEGAVDLHTDLATALRGAQYVQECGPETVAAKRALFGQLDDLCGPQVILASSTSGIYASQFTADLAHPERCLVAHPVNPPHLVPVVELVPAPDTAPWAVTRARELLTLAGQVPIVLHREIQGFALNRLQGALLEEALRLVAGGYIDPEDLDATVKHGLGLRWSFMGPLETIDLNAPGGVADYARRYGPLYRALEKELAHLDPWDPAVVAAVEDARRRQLPLAQLAERQVWRDRRLMALVAHKARDSDGDT
ncbi:MAG: 3-hydroxyacyl-CoA dehydrogenase [Candidatus Competibacterales bacterium]